ncbi:MAG: sialidase family protein [Bacteroidales bacterium]
MKKNRLIFSVLYTFIGILINGPTSAQDSAEILLFSSGDDGSSCYRIPALCEAPDGSLLAVADQRNPSCGDLLYNPNINLVLRKSTDQGLSWSPMRVIVDFPEGISASDPSFVVDKREGKVFLLFNYMDHNHPPRLFHHMVMESSDNGETWSEPVNITEEICSPSMKSYFRFITSGRGIQTRDGTLLHTLVTLEEGVFVIGSKDHGKTWFRLPAPIKSADESQIVEAEDGTWMVSARLNGKGYRMTYQSNDQGQSWKPIEDTLHADPGCNAAFIRLNKKDQEIFLLTHIHHPSERKGLTLCYSANGCQTWSEVKVIETGSAAYSSVVELPDNKIGVLYEKDDYHQIVFKVMDIREIR